MMLSLFPALLLVAAWGACTAHARTFAPSAQAQALVTSSLTSKDAVEGSGGEDGLSSSYVRRNQLNLGEHRNGKGNEDESVAVRAPSSVVADWSLVCQQLCGAGLGGQSCAPTVHCRVIEVPLELQMSNADALLQPNKEMLCKNLCGLELGDASCDCPRPADELSAEGTAGSTAPMSIVELKNRVCDTFCIHGRRALLGCGPCGIRRVRLMGSDGGESGGSDDSDDSGVEVPADLDVGGVATTTVSTAATPDWNELCASLCKTGDGGSLCNCDLSPFFY